MKRVLSVSLGSPEGDFTARTTLLGQEVELRRIGTNGDLKRYVQLLREHEGKVDAFGYGGSDMYLWCAGRAYPLRESMKVAANAGRTPIVDGSGLKNTLERETIRYLAREGIID